MLIILRSFSIWSILERWKSLISGCLMSWQKIKKIIVFKCHLLLFCEITMNHFLIGLCDVWRKVNFMTTSNDQISGWSEKLKSTSQSQTCTKKRSWSLLVVCCPSDPLQLSEFWGHHYTSEKYTQQVHEMHQKLQCLQSALVNRMSPVLLHDNAWLHATQPMLQKFNKLGYEGLPHLP